MNDRILDLGAGILLPLYLKNVLQHPPGWHWIGWNNPIWKTYCFHAMRI